MGFGHVCVWALAGRQGRKQYGYKRNKKLTTIIDRRLRTVGADDG